VAAAPKSANLLQFIPYPPYHRCCVKSVPSCRFSTASPCTSREVSWRLSGVGSCCSRPILSSGRPPILTFQPWPRDNGRGARAGPEAGRYAPRSPGRPHRRATSYILTEQYSALAAPSRGALPDGNATVVGQVLAAARTAPPWRFSPAIRSDF
jgi:hypothetical protein